MSKIIKTYDKDFEKIEVTFNGKTYVNTLNLKTNRSIEKALDYQLKEDIENGLFDDWDDNVISDIEDAFEEIDFDDNEAIRKLDELEEIINAKQ